MNFSETFTFYFLLLLLSDITLKITLNILTSIQILFHSIFFGVCLVQLYPLFHFHFQSLTLPFLLFQHIWSAGYFCDYFGKTESMQILLDLIYLLLKLSGAFSQINLESNFSVYCLVEDAGQLYFTKQSNSSISISMGKFLVLILVWNVSRRISVM